MEKDVFYINKENYLNEESNNLYSIGQVGDYYTIVLNLSSYNRLKTMQRITNKKYKYLDNIEYYLNHKLSIYGIFREQLVSGFSVPINHFEYVPVIMT